MGKVGRPKSAIKVIVYCWVCKKQREMKPYDVKRGKGHFCSYKCKAEYYGRRDRKYRTRKSCNAIARREYIKHFGEPYCMACGAIPADVHHIDRDSMNNDPNNLQCLCRSCHTTHHNLTTHWRTERIAK